MLNSFALVGDSEKRLMVRLPYLSPNASGDQMIPQELHFFRPGHEDFDQTHRPVEAARHAPAEIYTSPELYQLEKEQIWMRDWLAVGREEEIPSKGDYTALRILDEPV